jgi:BlaI family transcriptional regulator, penicillinase repressor
MARTPKDVTDAELRVLQALWEMGPATIRQLTDLLHPGGGSTKYATVQVLLDRLEEKQFVARQRTAGAHTFTAVVDRDELIGRKLRSVAETLCGGSVTPLLTHLMRTRKLSAQERQQLRALIDELDEGGKGKSGRR